MPEIKNTFLKSKMNKDLDDRLVPNGEYRDAKNINISTSQGDSVGAVQTSLGNAFITDFGFASDCRSKIIGHCVDELNEIVYVFITDYIDASPDKLSNFATSDSKCSINSYNFRTSISTKLVEGHFLNFSMYSEMLGVNLLENLLFFTDGRNQPRKINVTEANPGNETIPTFYTNEDQISVAKYYPFSPIQLTNNSITGAVINPNGGSGDPAAPAAYTVSSNVPCIGGSGSGLSVDITAITASGGVSSILINNPGIGYITGDVVNIGEGRLGNAKLTLTVSLSSTMKDVCSEFLPSSMTDVIDVVDVNSPWTITMKNAFPPSNFLKIGWKVFNVQNPSQGFGTVYSINTASKQITVKFPATGVSGPNQTPWVSGNTLSFCAPNPNYDDKFPGDCEFLKDKFVRFAYRFRFLDGEYSLISPFTQECFVPKQDGYITAGDEEKAFESTELEFFENKINEIDLVIPCPILEDNTGNRSYVSKYSDLFEKMHVSSIQILYKESNENSIKVIDDISSDVFQTNTNNILIYKYQSSAPYKVLPEKDLIRVSDVVPIKAFAQEVSGNRVIYGNFVNRHSSLEDLAYQVGIGNKLNTNENPTQQEYQNHNLKQNRNYQVGVVLSDRYGRQSDVILSSFDEDSTGDVISFGGSSIYNSFKSNGFEESLITASDTWPGDSIFMAFRDIIPKKTTQSGYPGIYSSLFNNEIANLYGGRNYTVGTNRGTTGGSGSGLKVDILAIGSAIGGLNTNEIIDLIISDAGTGYLSGDVILIDGPFTQQASFVYNPIGQSNLLGYYSYKIVVKQQEQEYYNAYLPAVINGDIEDTSITNTSLLNSSKANIVLYSDNVNKIPKDLSDVGPNQAIFRSNELLSFRVSNENFVNKQYYTGTSPYKVTQIGTLTDLGLASSVDPITLSAKTSGTGNTALVTFNIESLENIPLPGSSISINDTNGADVTGAGSLFNRAFYSISAQGEGQSSMNRNATWSNGDIFTFNPPSSIYNASSNPYIGILSTSDVIGNRPSGFSTQENSRTKSILTVAETKPVYSNLNIFWETTTSGLITDLNTSIILNRDITEAVAFSNISANFDEGFSIGNSITNAFFPVDGANINIVDVSAVGTLVDVRDGANNSRISEFSLETVGDGSFKINTAAYFLCSSNQLNNNFTFRVSIQVANSIVTEDITAVLDNVDPVFADFNANGFDLGSLTNTSGGKSLSCEFGFIFLENCTNGSADPSRNHEGLTWEIIKIECEQSNRPVGPNSLTSGGTIRTSYPNGQILIPSFNGFGDLCSVPGSGVSTPEGVPFVVYDKYSSTNFLTEYGDGEASFNFFLQGGNPPLDRSVSGLSNGYTMLQNPGVPDPPNLSQGAASTFGQLINGRVNSNNSLPTPFIIPPSTIPCTQGGQCLPSVIDGTKLGQPGSMSMMFGHQVYGFTFVVSPKFIYTMALKDAAGGTTEYSIPITACVSQ
jgi:hypothetical protein